MSQIKHMSCITLTVFPCYVKLSNPYYNSNVQPGGKQAKNISIMLTLILDKKNF